MRIMRVVQSHENSLWYVWLVGEIEPNERISQGYRFEAEAHLFADAWFAGYTAGITQARRAVDSAMIEDRVNGEAHAIAP